ncbi:MAG: GNAT family N-acetyltransferase [Christensenellales bacterium]|jgi:predicted GNAT family N-acyltransferase
MVQARYIPGNEDLSECYKLRTDVFVEEQGISMEDEFDGKDPFALHALVYVDGQPAATARMLFQSEDILRIGRICVRKEMRNRGLGDLVVRMMLARATETECELVEISAQAQAVSFYEKLGFSEASETYLEAGIPHIKMQQRVDKIDLTAHCSGACSKGTEKQPQ